MWSSHLAVSAEDSHWLLTTPHQQKGGRQTPSLLVSPSWFSGTELWPFLSDWDQRYDLSDCSASWGSYRWPKTWVPGKQKKSAPFFQLRKVFSYAITLRTKLQLLRMILHTEEESHKHFIRICYLDLQGSRSHLLWRCTDRRCTLPWGSRFLQNPGYRPNYMKSYTRWQFW